MRCKLHNFKSYHSKSAIKLLAYYHANATFLTSVLLNLGNLLQQIAMFFIIEMYSKELKTTAIAACAVIMKNLVSKLSERIRLKYKNFLC